MINKEKEKEQEQDLFVIKYNQELSFIILIISFLLFNGIVNELLYNNFFLPQVSWQYTDILAKPVDATKDIEITKLSIDLKNDDVSLDSFKAIVNDITVNLPKDTLFLNKCGKGQKNSYVAEKFRLLAIYSQLKYRIPTSVTLAQILLETGHGTSRNFKYSNQLFGVKCFHNKREHWFAYKSKVDIKRSRGEKMQEEAHCNWYPDENDEFNRYNRFINYANYFEAAEERYKKLQLKRYNKLFKQADPLNPVTSNYKVWTKGLKDGGWATDNSYTKLLNGIIKDRNFQVIDENVEKYRTQTIKEHGELYLSKKLFLYEIKIKSLTNTYKL